MVGSAWTGVEHLDHIGTNTTSPVRRGTLGLDSGSQASRCDALPTHASRDSCSFMNWPDKRARHLARMKRCHFRSLDASSSGAVYRLGTSKLAEDLDTNPPKYIGPPPKSSVYHQHIGPINQANMYDVEYCEVADDVDPTSSWMFFRIGPFETYGGYSWSRALVVFPEHIFVPWGGDRVFIGDHILGNADADGDILTYPPIHQHHYHFYQASNMWRQALNVHGDSECNGGQGTYCLLKEFPPGVAFYAKQRMGLWADFNDVRPVSSDALVSYVFAGIKLLSPHRAPRPIRHSYMMVHPFLGAVLDGDVRRGTLSDVGYPRGTEGRFATFTVNTAIDTVLWSTGVLPDVDEVLHAYFHVHREMVHDFWFFEAGPAALGLLEAPWATAFVSYLCANRTDSLFDRLQARLMRSDAYSTLICKYADQQHYRGDGTDTIGPAGGRVECPFPRPLEGHMRWTAVAFFRAQPHTSLAATYSMHAVVRVYHTTRSNTDLDLDGRWQIGSRHGPPRCDMVAHPHMANFRRTCGEEIYVPLDAYMIGSCAIWYPALRAHLMQLLNAQRAWELVGLMAGEGTVVTRPAQWYARVVSPQGLFVAALVIIAACCCGACWYLRKRSCSSSSGPGQTDDTQTLQRSRTET